MATYSDLNHSRSHFSKHLNEEKKNMKLENKSVLNSLVTMKVKKKSTNLRKKMIKT